MSSRNTRPTRRGLMRLVALAAASVLGSAAALAQKPDPGALVRQADSYRQAYRDAVMDIRLTRTSNREPPEESRLKVALRGANASLIRVTHGAQAGQQVLMTDEGLWVKLPRSARSVRITPLQRLLGDAAVGDIGRLRWQDDYEARFAEPAEGMTEGVSAWNLELQARSPSAPYARVAASLAKADGRPLAAEFFLKSGKAAKRVRFGPLESINDRQGIRTMELQDTIKADSRTEMVIERVRPMTVDARWFTLETLGQWD